MEINIEEMQAAIERELQMVVANGFPPEYVGVRAMMAYHLGWEGERAGKDAQGKRIRPLFLLLSAQAAGGDWHHALPAAAAVELVHNFSLIHDDIEDSSDQRRGRPTVWMKWGQPQAINAGDAMFTLAWKTLSGLKDHYHPELALRATEILQRTCIALTGGQYLDMAYEQNPRVRLVDYWPMVAGKTAALLGACEQIGALCGGADEASLHAFEEFGQSLGLAFQIYDDWLGIWGNAALTGKSTESDLAAGKKSFPVLYALEQKGEFSQRWRGAASEEEIPVLVDLLTREGAQDACLEMADEYTRRALLALKRACPDSPARQTLMSLADKLIKRQN
jgi:geranylgeranyl diphosphate synthase, type I